MDENVVECAGQIWLVLPVAYNPHLHATHAMHEKGGLERSHDLFDLVTYLTAKPTSDGRSAFHRVGHSSSKFLRAVRVCKSRMMTTCPRDINLSCRGLSSGCQDSNARITGVMHASHQLREGEDEGPQLGEGQLDALAGRSEDVILLQEDTCLAVRSLPDLDAIEGCVVAQQRALRVHQLILGAPPVLRPAQSQASSRR